MPNVHVLAVDGMVDWHLALLIAELKRAASHRTVMVALEPAQAHTQAGLRLPTDVWIGDHRPEEITTLLVPGSETWTNRCSPEVLELLRAVEAAGGLIAAVGSGTIPLARAGVLNDRLFTSESSRFLSERVEDFSKGERYRATLAANDRRVITAPARGYLELSKEVLAELEAISDVETWYAGFKNPHPEM